MSLLTVAEALDRIQAQASPRAARSTPLLEALGLTLAEEIASDIDSPPHDKAMMDGYAILSADGGVERQVVEEVFAGQVPSRRLEPGQATRIMTGAPLPAGADAVVPVEQTESQGESVRLTGPVPPPGKHIMPRGESMRAGQAVLNRGAVLRSAEIALLAEVGRESVSAIPQPSVGVLATGDELVPTAVKPAPGQIRNSNGPMLLSAVREAGAVPLDLGVAKDQSDALSKTLQTHGRGADVVLLSGGVSAGDRDLAPAVLERLGVEKVFHKVAVKPGKPLWFGVWRHSPSPTFVFGLPGNPVSSFVCFQVFVRPLLAALAGRDFAGLAATTAQLQGEINHRGGRETYLPARLEKSGAGPWTVQPVDWRGSADLAGLVGANALLQLPAEPVTLPSGENTPVLRLQTPVINR